MEKCSLCNTEFKNKYSLGNHLRYGCTNSSEYQSSVRIKKMVYIECKECHIIFEVPYAKRRRKFCSTKCYGIWITGNNNPCKKKGRYINCLVCGAEIYIYSSDTHTKYCSPKCFYENNRGDNNPSRRPEVGKKISEWKKQNHHCAGKTYEECYGVEKAKEIKNKMKENNTT
nr:hypothetical protein [Bacteroidota bacterium]